ncbi:MAG: helix-turn-helix transcriptional regulator [Anaerolineaceae bacterium]|nr:helix-turn-helix transcriptional regulator [Anaerolineaceae bacterium]
MPYKHPLPDPIQAKGLVSFIKSYMEDNGLSIRALASQMDLSPAYVSSFMKGERVPDAVLCNQIADKLNVPQFTVFKLAGWLDEEDEEIALSKLNELAQQDAEVQIILNLLEEEPQLKREILTTVLQNLTKWKEINDAEKPSKNHP